MRALGPLVRRRGSTSAYLFGRPYCAFGDRLCAVGAGLYAVGVVQFRTFGPAICRPLLYGVYFFAGVGIGAGGIDVGLVAADGALRGAGDCGLRRRSLRCSSGWA